MNGHQVREAAPATLTSEDHRVLSFLKKHALPVKDVPVQVGRRLSHLGFVAERLKASPDPDDEGAEIKHFVVTEAGHFELARRGKAPLRARTERRRR